MKSIGILIFGLSMFAYSMIMITFALAMRKRGKRLNARIKKMKELSDSMS